MVLMRATSNSKLSFDLRAQRSMQTNHVCDAGRGGKVGLCVKNQVGSVWLPDYLLHQFELVHTNSSWKCYVTHGWTAMPIYPCTHRTSKVPVFITQESALCLHLYTCVVPLPATKLVELQSGSRPQYSLILTLRIYLFCPSCSMYAHCSTLIVESIFGLDVGTHSAPARAGYTAWTILS